VLIHDPEEEKVFHEATSPDDWTRDDGYKLGGYPVHLTDLVEERKTKIKALVDQDALEIISDNVGYEDSGALSDGAPNADAE